MVLDTSPSDDTLAIVVFVSDETGAAVDNVGVTVMFVSVKELFTFPFTVIPVLWVGVPSVDTVISTFVVLLA